MLPEGTAAVSLPDDVIFDIFSRIPLNSVCRFRCVSKVWRDIISSPVFLAAHKSRHTELFLVDTGYFRGSKKRDLRLTDMDGNVVMVIEGAGGRGVLPMRSSDDLICVADGNRGGAHVFDPSTGKVLVSSPGLEVTKHHVHYSAPQNHEIFGIGCTTPSGVYKVVRVLDDSFYVLTIRDGSEWRRRTRPPAGPFGSKVLDRHRSPVTINGVMYFLTSMGFLLCFDLENELWKDDVIVIPTQMNSTESVYIAELNGALCMVQREYDAKQQPQDPHNSCTNIWIFDDDSDKGNWTKAYTIPKGPQGCRYMPLRVMHDGEKLLLQCVSGYPPLSSALKVYDPHTKTCTSITGMPQYPPGKIGLCRLHLEHLVSVNK